MVKASGPAFFKILIQQGLFLVAQSPSEPGSHAEAGVGDSPLPEGFQGLAVPKATILFGSQTSLLGDGERWPSASLAGEAL